MQNHYLPGVYGAPRLSARVIAARPAAPMSDDTRAALEMLRELARTRGK